MTHTTSDPHGPALAEVLLVEVPPDARDLTDGQGPPDPAAEQAPEPVASAALPFARRDVSGRYRGGRGGFELELRVDVDGARSLGKVSGDYYSRAGATTAYVGSWMIETPTVTVTETEVLVEGIATCSWSTPFTAARLSVPRALVIRPPGAATLSWSDAVGKPGATYACGWEASAFRAVEWEQDCLAGTVPFASYDTGSLPQPAGSAARTLSVVSAFAEAGLQMIAAGTPNIVPNDLSGPDARWDESELHAAMESNFSLWADEPQWKVYTLVATSHVDARVRGVMYDGAGSHQRQGMAVFYDAVQGTDLANQRAQLRTYVHELGHCFNLLHSWDKAFATPPKPLGPNGGLGDLSWMNYAWKFQPPPPAPGGEAAYWAAFGFQFTAGELVHLRHGMRTDVIMGGSDFATGSGDVDPTVFADRTLDHSGLALELRAAPSYALGEPVVIEIKLASTRRTPVRTHGRLHPRDGLVTIAVQEPSGRVRAYRPLMPRCADEAEQSVVLDDATPATYESAYVGYGQGGYTFEQVGTYRLRAVYVADDGSRVVSPTLSLRVRSPLTAADDSAAELLMADGQGDLLYLLGSDAPGLTGANDAMQELLDRHPKHPLAVYARLVRGVNDERSFKTVEPDKTLTVRSARTGEAARELRSVVAASRGDAGVDNITLNMVIRRIARAEVKAGDMEKATATLDAMPAVFSKKGVKEQVVQVIEAQAEQEKAQLLADYPQ